MKNSAVFKATYSTLLALGLYSFSIQAQTFNPDHFYIVKGEPINRGISLGDPKNWSVSVTGRQGESAGKKVSVSPTTYKEPNDAIQLTFSKKNMQGNFAIYGSPIDISTFKDNAYITIDMRIDQKTDKSIKVGMDCGYPCRAEVSINHMIKKIPKGQWFSLPIPLNCFKGDNFDLSKIVGPFSVSTEGRLTISVTNVRLEKMPDDDKGCVDQK
jgi:Galactose-binding domain-like